MQAIQFKRMALWLELATNLTAPFTALRPWTSWSSWIHWLPSQAVSNVAFNVTYKLLAILLCFDLTQMSPLVHGAMPGGAPIEVAQCPHLRVIRCWWLVVGHLWGGWLNRCEDSGDCECLAGDSYDVAQFVHRCIKYKAAMPYPGLTPLVLAHAIPCMTQ